MARTTNQKIKNYKKQRPNRKSQSIYRNIKKNKFFFFSIFLIHFFFIPSLSQSKIVERIIAIVNDQAITQTDLENLKKKIRSNFFIDDFLLLYEENPKTLLKDKKRQLQYLIQEKLLDSKIIQNQITISSTRVDKEIKNILLRRNLTQKELEIFLNRKGFKLSDYRNFIETSMKRFELIQKEISTKIRISDEDIASYYRKQKTKQQKAHIFKYTLSHIFIPFESNIGSKNFKEAQNRNLLSKKKAFHLYNELKKNKSLQNISFERLAFQYSEKNFILNGGPLGSFSLPEINPVFKKIVQQLKVNEFSKPLKTEEGYYILKLDKKTLSSNPEAQREKQRIRNILQNERFHQTLNEWLKEQENNAFIYKNQLASNWKKKFKSQKKKKNSLSPEKKHKNKGKK